LIGLGTGITAIVSLILFLQLGWEEEGALLEVVLAFAVTGFAFVLLMERLPIVNTILARAALQERNALVGNNKNIRFAVWTKKNFERLKNTNKLG